VAAGLKLNAMWERERLLSTHWGRWNLSVGRSRIRDRESEKNPEEHGRDDQSKNHLLAHRALMIIDHGIGSDPHTQYGNGIGQRKQYYFSPG